VAWTLDDTLALLGEGRPDWRLTPQQRAAVGAALEPGLILAGAGSGKTEVMAARVVHLVAAGQVRPDEVLGLTFTTKATASLAARVRSGLERLRRLAPAGSTAWVGSAGSALDGEPVILTYNGYGARLVAEHGLRIGVEPAARLAPEGLRWQLALSVVRRWSGPLDIELTPASVAERVRLLADELASHLVTSAEVRAATARMEVLVGNQPTAGKEAAEALEKGVARLQLLALVDAFERAKRDALLLDYGDQISLSAELARQGVVAMAERTAHRVVLLDEYQDTGVGQRQLLARLFGSGHPVTAVGDPAQSIYGFRGASVGNIMRFPDHFPRVGGQSAAVYPLTVNFRSGGAILDVANRIVAGLTTASGAAVSSASASGAAASVQPPVLLPREGRETTGPAGGEVRVRLLTDAEAEAGWVAEQLQAACGRRRADHAGGCSEPDCEGWHEVAVLCRRRSQFGLLRQALERAGVPVEVVGLGGLLDAPEVADLVAVLRVLHDATANAGLVRLLTGPRWRIGLRDLDAMGRRAAALLRGGAAGGAAEGASAGAARGAAGGPAPDSSPLRLGGDEAEVGALSDVLEQLADPELTRLAPLSDEAQRRLHRCRSELASLRGRVDAPLPDLIADVERTIGLDVELEATPARLRRGRRANVLAFLDVAADFVGLEGQTDLGAFLASLDAAEKAEDGYDIGVPSAADAVKLMTVHAAKGLEWDVVAVPGLSRGVFPSQRGTSPWPWRAEVLPGDLRGDRDDLPEWTDPTPAGCRAYKAECKAVQGAEERRLAYVAVTRAREVLLCSGFWWSATAQRVLSPRSEFLVEIEQACAAGAGVVELPAPQPAEGERNPLLSEERAADVSWPPAPAVSREVLWAADAVRRQLRPPAVDAPAVDPPEPDLADRATAAESERIAGWRRDAELLIRERLAGHSRRDVPLPQTLSVSDLVDLAADPQRYAARLARPMPLPSAPAARQGTSFHAWMEQRAGGRALLGPGDLPGASDESVAVPGLELRALQDAFLATSWASRDPVAVEVGFELIVDDVLVRGRIDAVYRRPDGGYDVIDYKTGVRPGGTAARSAAIQLACYRVAWADIAGVPPEAVSAGFLYVREGEDGLVRPPLLNRSELADLLAAPPVAPADLLAAPPVAPADLLAAPPGADAPAAVPSRPANVGQ
jgi:DNA helicase-2/ATP-dependent DNA helicase PcrA